MATIFSNEHRLSNEHPQLSLSLDSPPSSSPFPSPSSSFIPPPIPGQHEYNIKLPLVTSGRPPLRDSTDNVVAATIAIATPVSNGSHPPPLTSNNSCNNPSSAVGKRTSTTSQPLTMEGSPSFSKRASLASSRKAPPSPSVSRRTSGANNVSLSRAPSNATRRSSMLASTPFTAATLRDSRMIKIRDFAFPASDPRHTGQGVDAPRLSRQSGAYSDYDDLDSFGARRASSGGWGPLRFGSKLWNLATGGGGVKGSQGGIGDGTPMPSSSDFARNFDVSSPAEAYPPDSDGYDEEDGDDAYPDQEVPLLPGLYRAMFAFEPEGTSEMALADDQIVRIVGRGGGVGWAVAETEDGGHALVPESYLEAVELDEVPGSD